MRPSARNLRGFVLIYVLFFIAMLLGIVYLRVNRQYVSIRQVHQQSMKSKALALAEGAVAQARSEIEAKGFFPAQRFPTIDFPDGYAECSVTSIEPGNRVHLLALGRAGKPATTVTLLVEILVKDDGDARKTQIEAWLEMTRHGED